MMKDTILAIQRAIKAKETGEMDSNTLLRLSRRLKCVGTWASVQNKIGVTPGGYPGETTIKAIDAALGINENQ